ncbi:unnamed protein product [Hapterophycus canaliculatus]
MRPKYSSKDGNALKSSQKLRHPGAPSQPTRSQGSFVVGGTRGTRAGAQQPRPRKCSTGSRHDKGDRPLTSMRVPMAPLRLRWFPGNQARAWAESSNNLERLCDFFYHVLLVLDSYTFNSHLKAEFVAEITRLYQQGRIDIGRKRVLHMSEVAGTDDRGNSAAGEGSRGFTGTMVKLKVLAKFLGLLTFCPNWGISASDMASTAHEFHVGRAAEEACHEDFAQPTTCPLPLEVFLNHAWATAGLVGAVPWMADFLRMMKWDEVSSQVESLFQDLGSDLGVHGYRLSSLASKSVVDFGSPRKRGVICSGREFDAAHGSLDAEVVLTRRLIQNCCPYLEDVLTLIRSLGRAWKLGTVAGASGTPFRAGQSPRLIGASGISPRSRRVIKPHPLKPLRVLPSLAEQVQRGESSGEKAGTARGSAHTESTRLRLVEAFFHHSPGELQGIADFVVRYAVQNACEEVLADVIRPAIAAAVSRIQLALKKLGRMDHPPMAPGSVFRISSTALATPGREGVTRRSVDQLVAWTTAELGKNRHIEARSLAGKRGKAAAVSTTLALVPHSLSSRVRRIAAAIAGHHAQQAAERKLLELTTATISETISAYYDQDRAQAIVAKSQLMEQGAGSLSQDNLLPKAPAASDLCTFASVLLEAANCFVRISTESNFMDAVYRVSINKASDIKAIESVVRETLNIVQEIGQFRHSRRIPGNKNDATDAYFEIGNLQKEMSLKGARQNPITLGIFLTSLSRFYGALPDNQHDVWQSVRKSFSPSVRRGNAIGELIELAAIEWEGNASTGAHLVGHDGESSRKGGLEQESCGRLPPWDPLLRLLSWGLVPTVIAENIFLSCIGHASSEISPNLNDLDVAYPTECWQGSRSPSKDGLIAVATAVAKEYHSLGSGEDLSTVLLSDLLHVANKFEPAAVVASKPFHYHPMHFCRLIARLRVA